MNFGPLVILVLGKDARTHAIVSALRRSGREVKIYVITEFRIPGLLLESEGYLIWDLCDVERVAEYARQVRPDLAVIGPEEPLGAGVVDALQALGIPCFGPHQAAARIETSKSWSRGLLDRHDLAGNPQYEVFHAEAGIEAYLHSLGEFVIKPDGLTGGKGVRVYPEHFGSFDEAYGYAVDLVRSEGVVVIEERLDGEEFSLQTITDGTSVLHCPVVQDHKRAFPGDTGPNTGGMGSYSLPDHGLPFLDQRELDVARRLNESVIAAIEDECGEPYRGVLYGGFIATASGVRLIEYNARFGDPEALNVLSLFQGDFLELALATATGTLDQVSAGFAGRATVCKYVVPLGYPGGPKERTEVTVPAALYADPNIRLYWAATELQDDGRVMLTGSRALGVVGIGDTLAEAEQRAEAAAHRIGGKVRYRSDIGTTEAVARRIEHMAQVRSRPVAHAV